MATNFLQYSNAVSVYTKKTGAAWSNLPNSVGSNSNNLAWASCSDTKKIFQTEGFVYNFNSSLISSFLLDNPTIAYIKFRVRFSVDTGLFPTTGVSVSLQPFLIFQNKDIGVNFQSKNSVWQGLQNNQIITSEISLFVNNIPDKEKLIDSSFGFGGYFDVFKSNYNPISIRLYDVSIEIINGTGIGYLLGFTSNSVFLESGDSCFLDGISTASNNSNIFYLYNAGDEDLAIEQGAMVSSSSSLRFPLNPWPSSTTIIAPKSYYQSNITYQSQNVGINNHTISVQSVSPNSPATFNFKFNVVPVFDGHQSSYISPSFNNNYISNTSSFSLSSFPLEITSIISVKIYNSGSSLLGIQNVSVVGDGSISSGVVYNGASIQPSSFAYLNINLFTNNRGNKSFTVQIFTNSSVNSVYYLNFTYAVLPQYEVEFKEGFSSGIFNSILIDGQRNNLGTIEKDRSLSRYFVIKNSGIYKNITINSIVSSSKDLVLKGLPVFPYNLIPNSGNSLSFNISLQTSEVGLKEGSLLINYIEGNIYNTGGVDPYQPIDPDPGGGPIDPDPDPDPDPGGGPITPID